MASTKDAILGKIAADEIAWRGLVAAVEPKRMGEPGPMGDWSFRDLVSHLLSWRTRTIGRLEAAQRGAARPANPWPSAMDDDDAVNDWFLQQDAGRSVDELLSAYAQSFDLLAGAVDALPEAAFLAESADSPGYFGWRDATGEVESDFSGHFTSHAADIRAWLAMG